MRARPERRTNSASVGLFTRIPPTRISEPGGLSPWYREGASLRLNRHITPSSDARADRASNQFRVGWTLHPDTTNSHQRARGFIPLVSGRSGSEIESTPHASQPF